MSGAQGHQIAMAISNSGMFVHFQNRKKGDDGDNSHNHDDYKDGKDGKEDVNMIFMTDCDVDANNAEKSDRYIDGHG